MLIADTLEKEGKYRVSGSPRFIFFLFSCLVLPDLEGKETATEMCIPGKEVRIQEAGSGALDTRKAGPFSAPC